MASRSSIHIALTPDLSQFVQERVARGRYPSAAEMVREGLRLLEEREATREAVLADLGKKITVGMQQAKRGQLLDGDDVFDELESRCRRRRVKRS